MKPRATMLELSRKQRDLLADKLPDFANIAAGGWLFGQVAGGNDFSAKVAAAGLTVWMVVMVVSLVLSRDSE